MYYLAKSLRHEQGVIQASIFNKGFLFQFYIETGCYIEVKYHSLWHFSQI